MEDADQLFVNLLDLLNDDEDEEAVANLIDFVLEDLLDEETSSSRLNVGVNINAWRTLHDDLFSQYFRMTRPTFQRLVVAVGDHLTETNRLKRMKIPLDISVMLALWILANADTFRSTAAHFGVSKGIVFYHYVRFIGVMTDLKDKYICWPAERERDHIKEQFEDRYGYPGCVGAIDGTHLYVTAPLVQPRRYTNRHHTYSFLAQTVCDHNKLYRDVYVGEPGSIGDARMFQRSPLSRNLYRPEVLRPDEHLIGDQGYTLTDKIQIPYPQDTDDERQRHHNRCLSSSRSVVERSYELLKEEFPRVRKFRSYSITNAVMHIMTIFVLHNFIILTGNKMRGVLVQDANIAVDNDTVEAAKLRGAQKREYMCHLLWNEIGN